MILAFIGELVKLWVAYHFSSRLIKRWAEIKSLKHGSRIWVFQNINTVLRLPCRQPVLSAVLRWSLSVYRPHIEYLRLTGTWSAHDNLTRIECQKHVFSRLRFPCSICSNSHIWGWIPGWGLDKLMRAAQISAESPALGEDASYSKAITGAVAVRQPILDSSLLVSLRIWPDIRDSPVKQPAPLKWGLIFCYLYPCSSGLIKHK